MPCLGCHEPSGHAGRSADAAGSVRQVDLCSSSRLRRASRDIEDPYTAYASGWRRGFTENSFPGMHTDNLLHSIYFVLKGKTIKTDLYTGADLQNVCREAAMVALRSMRTACQVASIWIYAWTASTYAYRIPFHRKCHILKSRSQQYLLLSLRRC